MTSFPIESVEKIAKKGDYFIVGVFFLFFSRFEYALKCAGYISNVELDEKSEVKADWNKYAQSKEKLFKEYREESFLKAVDYLRKSPPKKQIKGNGRFRFSDDNFGGDFNLDRALNLIRRIRNNLFHGGKFPGVPENDIARNQELIKAGLSIMQGCLDFDKRLQTIFLEELI